MSEPIEITPELLAELKWKADSCKHPIWTDRLFCVPEEDGYLVSKYLGPGRFAKTCIAGTASDASHIAAANPAVMLAMIERIRQLEAAQCWAIVTIETGVIDGPYATKEAAENERLAELCDDPNEPMYRVEPWKGGA